MKTKNLTHVVFDYTTGELVPCTESDYKKDLYIKIASGAAGLIFAIVFIFSGISAGRSSSEYRRVNTSEVSTLTQAQNSYDKIQDERLKIRILKENTDNEIKKQSMRSSILKELLDN